MPYFSALLDGPICIYQLDFVEVFCYETSIFNFRENAENR